MPKVGLLKKRRTSAERHAIERDLRALREKHVEQCPECPHCIARAAVTAPAPKISKRDLRRWDKHIEAIFRRAP
jgi:ribonuclease P protein component